MPDTALPCGKCPECTKRKAAWWSFRLMQEEKVSSSAWFITLTFDTDHVPISPRTGYMTLEKRPFQLFMKRLRKRSRNDLKYFCVGEYGGRRNRPHFHVLLFNSNPDDVLEEWKEGSVYFGTVTEASVGYCLKYMMKPGKIPMHRNDDRVPEFRLMSKGLGKNYLSDQMLAWHKADLTERMYCVLQDGKKVSMPRYYKDRVYDEFERIMVGAVQAQKMREKIAEEEQQFGDDYVQFKSQAKLAAYAKMYAAAEKDRDLF